MRLPEKASEDAPNFDKQSLQTLEGNYISMVVTDNGGSIIHQFSSLISSKFKTDPSLGTRTNALTSKEPVTVFMSHVEDDMADIVAVHSVANRS